MSWFDATGLANIAKTALKEAQKTIDKALDIRDDEDDVDVVESVKSKASSPGESSLSRGSKDVGDGGIGSSATGQDVKDGTLKERSKMPTSNWGSFSGSFFQVDHSKSSNEKSVLISKQPQKSLSLILSGESSQGAPLATPETELTPVDLTARDNGGLDSERNSNSVKNSEQKNSSDKDTGGRDNLGFSSDTQLSSSGDASGSASTEDKVVTRPRGRKNSCNRNSYVSNRLSALSIESDGKRSSESVEVLGSVSCTTSPDTDLPSISASSSLGLPVSSSCTDSVEVIDSSASPSSIEVLVDGTGSGRTTQSSCINSPKDDFSVTQNIKGSKTVSSPTSSGNDVSPESFEVIPDLPECDDEISRADSYTSASESTGPTVLEPSYQYSYRTTESYTDLSQASSKFRSGDSTPDVSSKFPATARNSCDILSESDHEIPGLDLREPSQTKSAELTRSFIESEKQYQRCKTSDESFETARSESGRKCRSTQASPTKKLSLKGDESGYHLRAEDFKYPKSDPSAKGSQQAGDYRSLEKGESDASQNSSFYVKNLLSEAMREMSGTRETSPTLSEKSRSDLIKVGSEQTSGHTSGDELETTTSSDIEIISRYSPNGDSSSTASRHSPAKLLHQYSKSKLSLVAVDILGKATQSKNKGHQREPSEASSFCSEDNFSEVEKLAKRVSELTEILEARESRLNDLRKINLELQERNQELKKEAEQAKKEASTGLLALKTDSEKDELIRELKEEGEKLSKKELKQANLIKTLRAHEKSQQSVIDNNATQIQNLTKTVDDLKAELSAKKESEKVLNDTVKQMNKKITRQDEEIANLLGQMEKAVVKAEELKYSLDSRETELAKCKQLLAAEDSKLQDARSIADSKGKQLERLIAFQDSAEIKLEDLSQKLKKAEEMHSEREKHNKEEVSELMRRLQEAEGRNEELAQSVSKATRPLLRQMEALQATTAHERETWEKQERNLLQKLEDAESRLSSVTYHEKSFKQETIELRTKVSSLEEQLQVSSKEVSTWKYQVNSLSKQLDEAKQALETKSSDWARREESLKMQINDLKGELTAVEQQLASEKANADVDRRRLTSLQDQLKEREAQNRDSNSPRSSPTLSFGRVSLSESLSSNVWPQFGEDGFDTTSVSGKYSNVYENLRAGNATSLIESLQAQLKMRDGEISQLQWESQRRDAERTALTTELSSLTSKLEDRETRLRQAEATSDNLKELQTKYDALLEMYGEKVEEVEELRLDLQDVKEMYKSQIDHLLQKEKNGGSL